MQATPRAFKLLKFGVVHHPVDLFGQLAVDLGDDRLDGAVGIRRQPDAAVLKRLMRQRAHGVFHRLARLLGLGFELFLQERGQVVGLQGVDSARVRAFGHCGHGILRKRFKRN